MSFFGGRGGGNPFHGGSVDKDWGYGKPLSAPSEQDGSGPLYRIDPDSGDGRQVVIPGAQASGKMGPAEYKATEAASEPAAEFAEIRGFCSVAAKNAIVLALALSRDEHSSLEYRLGRPATDSDNGEVMNVLTKWKPLSPP